MRSTKNEVSLKKKKIQISFNIIFKFYIVTLFFNFIFLAFIYTKLLTMFLRLSFSNIYFFKFEPIL